MNYLYINGQLADLSPDTVIAITINSYNPIFPKTIGVTYSNQFTLPLTNTNREIIGLGDSLKSQSDLVNSKFTIRYVQDGVEIIPQGTLIIKEISTTISCVIYNDLEFYSSLKDRTLNDIDYTDINPTFTTSYGLYYDNILEAEVAGGGGEFFTAVCDLGQNIVNNGGTIEYVNNDITVVPDDTVFIPMFFGYKQVLQRIMTDLGYTYDWGKLFDGVNDNPKFNSMAIMQQGYADEYRYQYSEKFRDEVEFSALVDADETFSDIGAAGTRRFFFLNEVQRSDFYLPDPVGAARSRYYVVNADTTGAYFQGTFRFKGKVNRTGNAATVQIFINGTAGTGAAAQVLNVGDNDVDIYATYNDIQLKDGDIIEVGYTQVGANPTSVTYYAGGEFSFECGGGPTPLSGNYLYLNQILPPLNQLDVFKDFLFRFGQIPKFNGQSITFKSVKDILADGDVIDWTNKRDKTKGSHEIHLDLSQRNYFRYISSDALTSEGFRQGYFDIADDTLPVEDYYESIWASTYDRLTEGIKCGAMDVQETPAANEIAKFAEDTGPRLMMTRMNYSTEPDLVMGEFPDNTPQSSYVVACFSKVDSIEYERSMGYDMVIAEWHADLVSRLQDARIVKRYYYLTPGDIYLLDPHKMILDDGVTFMFPVIKTFVPGKLTEVQMIKI